MQSSHDIGVHFFGGTERDKLRRVRGAAEHTTLRDVDKAPKSSRRHQIKIERTPNDDQVGDTSAISNTQAKESGRRQDNNRQRRWRGACVSGGVGQLATYKITLGVVHV